MPLPWIIGETGFTASSGKTFAEGLDGDLTQQENFADLTLNRTRDCHGSGYSWWNYQDVYHDDNIGTPGYGGNFFGLLERGITTCPDPLDPCSAMDKPVVNFFDNYAYPNPVPGNCAPPSNYYDPFNHATNSTTQQYTVTGHVEDQYGNDIEGAIVIGWTLLNILSGEYKYAPQYTFTDENGNFTIIPYDYAPPFIETGYFTAIRISAISTQVDCINWGVPGALTHPQDLQNDLIIDNSLFPYNRNYYGYDKNVNNVDVLLNAPAPVNFKGWNTLTVNSPAGSTVIVEGNGITGATSDFTARKEIHISDEFHVQYGSEVHIYPSTVFPECIDYTGYRTSSQNTSSSVNDHAREKWIELAFNSGNEITEVEVIPNPTNGYCTVRITGTNSFQGELILTDMASRNIFLKNINELSEQLNLSSLSKGIYYLEIKNSTQVFNKKIVLN